MLSSLGIVAENSWKEAYGSNGGLGFCRTETPFLGQHTLSALRLGEQAAPPSVRVPEGRRWHPSDFPPWASALGRLPLDGGLG